MAGSQQAVTTDRGGSTLLFNIPDPVEGVAKATQDIDEKVRYLSIFYDLVNFYGLVAYRPK